MLNYIKHNIYFTCLFLGTMMACSSSSWILCWIGLEINLMSLIPLIIIKMNPFTTETSIKYFIAQAMASVMVIFISAMMFFYNSTNSTLLINYTIIVALAIKMGVAPFHFWLPQIIQTSEWLQILIILTWQKIAPMMLIFFMKNNLMKFIIISSCVIGVMGAINQTSIKKIIVYSSILHSGWLLSTIMNSVMTWCMYFVFYSIISTSVIIPLMFYPFLSIKQMFFFQGKSFPLYILFTNFLSMAGIPPFLGFIMKLITLIYLALSNFDLLVMSTLIMSSLISLYYYMRMMISSMAISSKKNKYLFNHFDNNKKKSMFLSLSMLTNLIFPVSFILY